jgi:hypothetical protein
VTTVEGVKAQTIQLPVTMDTANRRRDRSVSLRFTTNLEVPTEAFAELDRHVNQSGWLLFKENAFDLIDVPKEDAPAEFQKKPSVRLRGVLYRVWEQTTDQTEDFDSVWYPRKMEQIIDRFKEFLP